MTNYLINIKEKEKFIRKLTFKKLNDEVYDVMYKKTILENTRRRLSFYLLLFFLILKEEKTQKTLIYYLFENNLQKIEDLNNSFREMGRNLKGGEYAEYKKEHGLDDLFKYDVFFYLLKIFGESEKIIIEYNDFFQENLDILEEFNLINRDFGVRITNINYELYGNKIDDIRMDENGDLIDLSKSIFHTIHMRMSKRMDLALSYRTDIKKIISQSPLEIELIQSIDPNIILEVWDKFNLFEYVGKVVKTVSENSFLSTASTVILSQIAYNKFISNNLDKRNKNDKILNQEIESENSSLRKDLNEKDCSCLLNPIERQIENADLIRDQRIKELEDKVKKLEESKKNRIEKEELEQEIKQRKNIEIKIEKIEIHNHYGNNNDYNINGNVENIQNENSASNQTN